MKIKHRVIVEEFVPYYYSSHLDYFIKELGNIKIKHCEPGTSSLKHTIVWWLKYFIPTSEFFNMNSLYVETEDKIIFSIQPMGFGLALIALSEPVFYEEINAEEARLSKFMDTLTKDIKFEGILRISTKPIDKNFSHKIKKPLCKKGFFSKWSNNNLIIQNKKKKNVFILEKYWSFKSEGLSSEKGAEIEKVCESISEILSRNYLEDTAAWCAYDRRRLTIIYIKHQDYSKVDFLHLSEMERVLGEKKIMGSSIHIENSNDTNNFSLFIPRKKYHKGGLQPRFLIITNSDDLNWSAICAVCYEWNLYYTKMRHYFIFEDFYSRFFEYINDSKKYKLKDIIDFSDNLRRFSEELRIKNDVTSNKFISYCQVKLIENKLDISDLENVTSLDFLRNHILPSEPGSITHDLSNKVSEMISMMEDFSEDLHNIYTNERNLEIQTGLYIIQLLIIIILPMTILQTFMPAIAQDKKIIVFVGATIISGLLMLLVHRLFGKRI